MRALKFLFFFSIYLYPIHLMNNNLTINIYVDDQLRSLNNNNNDDKIKIESNSIQILYPQLIDKKDIPSVPNCHENKASNFFE